MSTMQNRPDKSALLEAVARFLEREIKPTVKDPALSFRVLIAANLCQLVSAELQMEDMATDAELDRLAALLPDLEVDLAHARLSRENRRLALERYNRELCARIQGGSIPVEPGSAAWSHVTTTLRGELLTSSPRFDTGLDIE
ncbi:Hypothetical protein A7982_10612 [Minicystis rosea]|nr:Hypothetical protein A7982_10612 [Minicystis rosea]